MVARDGIEPPTPAFSGLRSTPELPGLFRVGKIQFNKPVIPTFALGVSWAVRCVVAMFLIYFACPASFCFSFLSLR